MNLEARPNIRTWRFWFNGASVIETADTWYWARDAACIKLKCDWSEVKSCPA